MNVTGDKGTWSGWFSGAGDMAPVVQSLVTIVGGIATTVIAILLVARAIFLGIKMAKTESPEDRKMIKGQIIWFVAGATFIVVGATITLLLMTTIGKAVKTSSPAAPSHLINHIIQQVLSLKTLNVW